LFPWPPLRQAPRSRIPQRAITATRSVFPRREGSRRICSVEHESTLSTTLGDNLQQTRQSPATTRIETMAESLTPLRAILETIRDNAQRALTLIGQTEEQRSLAWKCMECGHVKRFTRPVPAEVAPPCPKCNANSFEPC
jgi:rubrerythrin